MGLLVFNVLAIFTLNPFSIVMVEMQNQGKIKTSIFLS